MIEQLAGVSIQGRCFSEVKPFIFFPKKDVRLALIYGANGSGKSTISKAFRNIISQEYPELQVETINTNGDAVLLMSPSISVFDEEYIDRNVKINDDGLGSIVLLGEQVELQSEIDTTQEKIRIEKEKLDALQMARAPYFDATNVASAQYHWERIKSNLKGTSEWARRDSELKGNRVNSAVNDGIVREICSLHVHETIEQLRLDFEQKKRLLQQAVTPNPAYQNPIRCIDEKSDFEEQIITLLAVKLEEPCLTEREKLIMGMVQGGHQKSIESSQQYFLSTHTNICPFCLQEVTEEYRHGLLESIQRVLNKEVDEHKRQLISIVFEEINDYYEQYRDLDVNTVEAIHKALEECNELIRLYKEAVAAKIQNIYTPIIQPDLGLAEKIKVVNILLQTLEQKRSDHMKSIKQSTSIRNSLLLINKKIAHLFCIEEYNAYQKQTNEGRKAEEAYQKQEAVVKEAERHLETLLQRKMNLRLAIECINESLVYVFFSKDRLAIELNGDKYYLKSKGYNVKPKDISQGERNIIALCYFFIQIAANRELSKRYAQEQLLVIDDPVSSFDFENKVGILSLLRREIKKVVFGNNNSRVLLLTHDLTTMFDAKKALDEIGEAAKGVAGVERASSAWLELSDGTLQQFTKARSEYAQLIDDVFKFADGAVSLEVSIGNKMRRVVEAFSTFCYRKKIEDVAHDRGILLQLGEYSEYFENRMYRLLLHGESHFEEQIYNFHDAVNLYEFFSMDEKIKTARDILCFMYLLNKQHVKAYLPRAEQKLSTWCADIRNSMLKIDQISQIENAREDKARIIKLYDLPLSAGLGIDMFDDEAAGEDYETSNEGCDFALRISGNSMEPDITNGSIVLIRKQDAIEFGEIGAFFHNGCVYCKKYGHSDGKTALISINTHYRPIIIEDDDVAKCYGKVIDIIPKKSPLH